LLARLSRNENVDPTLPTCVGARVRTVRAAFRRGAEGAPHRGEWRRRCSSACRTLDPVDLLLWGYRYDRAFGEDAMNAGSGEHERFTAIAKEPAIESV
jgi:hypothetical protein